MYKYERNKMPAVIRAMFSRNSDVHNVNTRQANCLHLPLVKNASSKKSFKYNAIKIYNSYYCTLNFSLSFTTYKRKVKCYLLQNELHI